MSSPSAGAVSGNSIGAGLFRVIENIGIPVGLFTRGGSLFLAILAGQVVSFAVQAVVARHIGPSSYGIYSYAFTLANLLALVSGWGGDRMLVRFVSDYHSRGRQDLVSRVIAWTMTRMGSVACLAGAGLVAAGWMLASAKPEEGFSLMLAGCCVPVLVMGNLSENALRATGSRLWADLPNRLVRPVLMGSAFGLILMLDADGTGAIGTVGSNAIAIASTTVLGLVALRVRVGPSRASVRTTDPRWHQVGLALGLGTLAIYLTQQIDVLLLAYLADTHTLGIYSAVTRVASALAFANIAAVATVQPLLAKHGEQSDRLALQSILRGGARFAFFLNLAVGLPVMILAEPILAIFGPAFAEGANALRVLTLATMVASACSTSGAALSMRGHERHATMILIGGCVLTLVLNLLLIPYAGFEGAALATGASTVAWNIGLLVMAQRKLGVLALPFGPSQPAKTSASPATRRVTVFLASLAGGGAERVMLNLVRGLMEAGHPTTLVLVRNEGAYRDLVPPGVDVVVLGSTRIWQAIWQLAFYLRRERPWRLYAAMEDGNLIALCARLLGGTSTEIVCGIHNTPSLRIDRSRDWRSAIKVRLLRWFYRSARAVVAVSDGVAADAKGIFRLNSQTLLVIANPALLPELKVRAAEPVSHPWLDDRTMPVLLACGRLTGQKDYPTMLHAVARVQQERPVRLIILGEGELRAELEALRDALGLHDRVDMPGFADNPYAYMARCDVYLLSSRFEGSPVVLVEALACGARVVSTDCPNGPRETLSGVPGTSLVPVGDADALAKQILQMLEEPAPAPGMRWLTRFDYRSATRAYLELRP